MIPAGTIDGCRCSGGICLDRRERPTSIGCEACEAIALTEPCVAAAVPL